MFQSASCVAAFLRWSHGKSLAFSVVCWSNGKSLAFSVPRLVLRYISRVVWGSGGPTTTLSRIPWSGCPAVNLSRYPLLSAGCRWFKRFTGNAAGRTSKMTPTWLQNGTKTAAKWGPEALGGVLEPSWKPLGALKKAWSAKGGLPGAYGALLDGSWGALGAEKSTLERLLATPREIPKQISAIWGGQKAPERGAKRVQNRVQEAT